MRGGVGQGRSGQGRAGRGGWGEVGWGGFKKSKPIPVPSHGVGLKSYPIPAPPPLWGRENLRVEGQVKQDGEKLSSLFLSMTK